MTVMRQQLAICRLESSSPIPEWAGRSSAFTAITRTATELSIVAADDVVPSDVRAERGWRAVRVEGPIAFDLVGILASITAPLAKAAVSIMAIATFDTDYVLIRAGDVATACQVLRASGHTVVHEP